MDAHVGMRGATQQSWGRDGIRVVIREIQDEHPRIGEKRLVELLAERMREDNDALYAAAEYAVKNALNVQEQYARRQMNGAARPTAEQLAERREEIKRTASQIILLNQEMPNGKRVRFCTLDYLWRIGGGWKAVGRRGDMTLAGQQYDEAALRSKFLAGGGVL